MKRIAILGSTGSVGINVLRVIRALKGQFRIIALTSNTNIALLQRQIEEFNPPLAAINDLESAAYLINRYRKTKVFSGVEGMVKIATNPGVDLVVICVSGGIALLPLVESIRSKKEIALANKEAIVMAGGIINRLCKRYGVKLIPIDSEHNAIFQCLNGRDSRDVKRIILTASGGPFNFTCKKNLMEILPRQALRHPRWRMGKKITIDSATLMNKGLEVIEAHWLFNMPPERIAVLIHPEAVIHSMVEFKDGNILGLFGIADMRLPIQYALTYPKRCRNNLPQLDFAKAARLTFQEPDLNRFPCLKLAYQAAKKGKSLPCVLNAADEVCVDAFLKGRIRFMQIPDIIFRVLKLHKPVELREIKEVFSLDRWARAQTHKIIGGQ